MNPPRPVAPHRWSRYRLCLFLFVVLLVAILLFCGYHAQATPDRYAAQPRAQGKKLTLIEVGLERGARPSPQDELLESMSGRFERFRTAAEVSAPRLDLGTVVGGGRSLSWTQPYLNGVAGYVVDWAVVSQGADWLEKELSELHALLRAPPPDPGWDYRGNAGFKAPATGFRRPSIGSQTT